MFRHPTVIAAFILGGSVLVSAVSICIAMNSLNQTIRDHPVGGAMVSFPNALTLENLNDSPLRVSLENARPGREVQPLQVQQKP